ncbi:MAG: hypothetical protein A2144_14720 [Chloroflexi bacterium RBG_16_50_9]|nr:MAG: hypothetical protein A2144_14720 [Chloroflexi bacterium RBG_16_50_9]
MRFKSFTIGKPKDKGTIKHGAAAGKQINDLEEQVSQRTRELEDVQRKLKELSATKQASKDEEVISAQPHKPLGELTIEPEAKSAEKEADNDTSPEEISEEVQVIKIKAEDTPKPIPPTAPESALTNEAKKGTPGGGEDDSLSNLFSQEEENINPLAALIANLPDVSAQELLDDLHQINEIIKERRHK